MYSQAAFIPLGVLIIYTICLDRIGTINTNSVHCWGRVSNKNLYKSENLLYKVIHNQVHMAELRDEESRGGEDGGRETGAKFKPNLLLFHSLVLPSHSTAQSFFHPLFHSHSWTWSSSPPMPLLFPQMLMWSHLQIWSSVQWSSPRPDNDPWVSTFWFGPSVERLWCRTALHMEGAFYFLEWDPPSSSLLGQLWVGLNPELAVDPKRKGWVPARVKSYYICGTEFEYETCKNIK